MSVELKVPEVGESIREVQVGRWLKAEGDPAARDEAVVEIETDKVSLEIPAPADGRVARVLKREGEAAVVGEVIGYLEEEEPPAGGTSAPEPAGEAGPPRPEPAPPPAPEPAPPPPSGASESPLPVAGERLEEAVPMSPLRAAAADRIARAHRDAAVLAAVGEIDMTAAAELVARHGDAFREKHGAELAPLAIFVKAAADALTLHPALNSEIRGDEIVLRRHADIAVEIHAPGGPVLPVLRNVERTGIAGIAVRLADLSRRAEAGALSVEDLAGGTFSIQSAVAEGTLLAAPALNPPQAAALGLSAVADRPAVVEGRVAIRPMTYVTLAFDRRLATSAEAAAFLSRVKQCLEEPARIMLQA